MLRAISTRDTAAARRVLLPGAHLIGVPDPANATRPAAVQSDTTFYRTLPQGTVTYLERMWSPTVQLFGSVALVAAQYDFHRDGKFSHCGVDTFTLVRSMGEWRISGVVYTTQRAGCRPGPYPSPSAGSAR